MIDYVNNNIWISEVMCAAFCHGDPREALVGLHYYGDCPNDNVIMQGLESHIRTLNRDTIIRVFKMFYDKYMILSDLSLVNQLLLPFIDKYGLPEMRAHIEKSLGT